VGDNRNDPGANSNERRRWNDERWTATWPQREQLTSSVMPALQGVMALHVGEHVLDVGSGGGESALSAARAVGPGGVVVGADLSVALIDLARQRAGAAGVANVRFVKADVQTDRIDGAPFDVAISQFGVMFFDEPVAAFANIGSHLRPGGRLVFACWQPVARNPWHVGAVLQGLVPPAPAPGPGKSRTGPFTLGEPGHTAAVLEDAGFTGVRHHPYDVTVEAGASAVFDPLQLEFLGVAPEHYDDAKATVAHHLEQFHVGADLFRYPLAFLVFEATRP
jgi:SAM-dependent methyltransferase